jgi:hypothetical protein
VLISFVAGVPQAQRLQRAHYASAPQRRVSLANSQQPSRAHNCWDHDQQLLGNVNALSPARASLTMYQRARRFDAWQMPRSWGRVESAHKEPMLNAGARTTSGCCGIDIPTFSPLPFTAGVRAQLHSGAAVRPAL